MVADDRRLPGNGRAYQRALPRPYAGRKRNSLSRPCEKKHIFYKAKSSNQAGELDFTYYNAVYTVQNALAKVKDEKGMKRVEKFLKQEPARTAAAPALSDAARAPRLRGIGLDEACRMTLTELTGWVNGVPGTLRRKCTPWQPASAKASKPLPKG